MAKALLYVASMFVGKIGVYQLNNFLQMPLVLKAQDPALFPNDSYVAALQHYPIPLWHWISPLFSLGSAVTVLTVLTLLLRLFVFWAAGKLALALTDGNRFAEVAAWAVFAAGIDPPVGAGTVYPFTFEHTAASIGCLLLAAAFLLRQKKLPFAIFAGLAGFFNLLYGLQGLIYFAAIVFASPIHRQTAARWVMAGVASLALMAPSILLATHSLTVAKLPPHQLATLNRLNYPYHFFPSTWSGVQWGRLVLAVLAMVFIGKWTSWKRESRIAALATTAVMALFIGLAYYGGDLLEVSLLISTQPARAADFWFGFASVAMASFFATKVSTSARPFVALTSFAGLLVTIAFWRYGSRNDTETGKVLVGLGVAVLAVGFAMTGKNKTARVPSWASVAALGLLLAGFLGESLWALDRMRGPDGNVMVLQTPFGGPKDRVYAWIASNTPKSARFLAPPSLIDFRVFAQRSPFLSENEGAAMMWEPPFALDWLRRVQTLGVWVDPQNLEPFPNWTGALAQNYERIDDGFAKRLAEVADLDYWVLASERTSALPVVYDDGAIKVVKLR